MINNGMYYTVYKVTNKINGKIYIGSHKTKDLDDNYMGSGKYLMYAFSKYGIENFEKEILYAFDNPEAMYAKESELVDVKFISETNTYNLKVGGFGGFDYINSTGKNIYGMNGKTDNVTENFSRGRRTQAEKRADKEYLARYQEKQSKIARDRYANGYVNPFKGKTHTEEAKKAIGAMTSQSQRGVGNSQFGKRWIHSLELKQSKKIGKNDPLPSGWIEGRKMKF